MQHALRRHRRSRAERRAGAVVAAMAAALGLVLVSIPLAGANAAESPHAGTYSGSSTAYGGAQVTFTINSAGNLTSFDTESYITCGGFPTAMPWTGIPSTPVTADVAFDLGWSVGSGGEEVRYELEDFVISLDGTASGEGYAHMPALGCQGSRFTFSATLQGGVPDPEYDPQVTATPSVVTVSELADPGVVFTGSGFAPDSEVELIINGDWLRGSTADGDGNVSFTYTSTDLGVGVHTVMLSAYEGEASGTWEVVADAPGPVYDPEASVNDAEVTESELADPGVVFSGTGFAPESAVTLAINGATVSTADADADGNVSFAYVSADLGVGTHEAVLSADEGSASVSFTVIADSPDPVYDPEASVNDAEVTESELADPGVVFSGTGFAPESAVTLAINGATVSTADADADGNVSFAYVSADLGVGTHEAVLSADEGSASVSFTVIADTPDPVYDPEASVSDAEVTESELADPGVVFSGTGFAPESTVTLAINGATVSTADADADGNVSFAYVSADLGVGTHEVVLSADEGSASVSFSVIADTPDPVYDPEASVNDAEVTESELADPGVVFSGTGFAPESTVTLAINGAAVTTADADADGNVSFAYVSADLGVGTHEAVLSADEGSASVSFTVVADPAPLPETIPAVPPTVDDLVPGAEGDIVAPDSARAGSTITLSVPGIDPGSEIGVWLFSTPVYLGAHVVGLNGTVQVTIPASTTAGDHQLAAWSADGELIGWDDIVITAASDILPVTGADGATLAGAAWGGVGVVALGLLLMLHARRGSALYGRIN